MTVAMTPSTSATLLCADTSGSPNIERCLAGGQPQVSAKRYANGSMCLGQTGSGWGSHLYRLAAAALLQPPRASSSPQQHQLRHARCHRSRLARLCTASTASRSCSVRWRHSLAVTSTARVT
jgi:hypothetical protein